MIFKGGQSAKGQKDIHFSAYVIDEASGTNPNYFVNKMAAPKGFCLKMHATLPKQ